MTAPTPDGPVDVPETSTVIELHAILSHVNAEWAQRDPHKAMQVHIACQIGECVAKTIAWGELVRLGVIVPDSIHSMMGTPMTGDLEYREDKNPGREGGPLGFQHTERGIVPIGDDGFPLIDDEHPELDSVPDPAALDRYPVIDVEAILVIDTERGP